MSEAGFDFMTGFDFVSNCVFFVVWIIVTSVMYPRGDSSAKVEYTIERQWPVLFVIGLFKNPNV